MGRIDNLTVQRILDTADIVDVVGEFVTLKRSGANYVGLCPFHNERSPSFSVSRSKGICKCFSCGKGGNVVNFLMELRQMNYGEALRWLAAKYGIEIQEQEMTDDERRRERERENLLGVMRFAADFYSSALDLDPAGDVGPRLRSVCDSLGITPVVARQFRLGACGTRPFSQAAAEAGFTRELLLKSGLIGPDGSDVIADSLILPVISRYGKPVGLLALPLGDCGEPLTVGPKMLINPDNELLGAYQARQSAAKRGMVVVCRDPSSMLRLVSAGVTNAVALLSPGFSEQRVTSLRKMASEVVLLLPKPFFWDAYGAMSEASALLADSMSVRIAAIPHSTDPDTFIDTADSDTLEDAFGHGSSDIVSFKLGVIDSLRRRGGRSFADYERWLTADLVSTLAAVADPILREIYVSTAAPALRMSVDQLEREMARR